MGMRDQTFPWVLGPDLLWVSHPLHGAWMSALRQKKVEIGDFIFRVTT